MAVAKGPGAKKAKRLSVFLEPGLFVPGKHSTAEGGSRKNKGVAVVDAHDDCAGHSTD